MPHTLSPDLVRRRRLIFCIVAAGYLLAVFQRLCPAVLAADMMADLGAGGAGIGILGSAYFYPYALMQLPTGLLVDSWGPRKTFAVFFGLAALGSVALGMAGSLTWAVAWRVCVGAGVATVFVASLKLLAAWYRPQEFGAMAGWLLAMGGVGSLAATAPLAWAAAELGWRGSFVAVGLVTAALAWAGLALIRNRPPQSGTPAGHEVGPHVTRAPLSNQSDHSGKSGEAGQTGQSGQLLRNMASVLRKPAFWPLAGWIFGTQAVPFAFAGLWGGPYLRHVHGFDLSQSGLALALAACGLIVGGPVLGWVSSRIGRKPTLAIASAGQTLIMLPLVLHTADVSQWLLYPVFFGLGLCGTSSAGIAFTSVKELFPLRIAGTATGLLNIFPFTAGALYQPLLGLILESHGRTPTGGFTAPGYQAAFAVLMATAAASFVFACMARETLGRAAEETN